MTTPTQLGTSTRLRDKLEEVIRAKKAAVEEVRVLRLEKEDAEKASQSATEEAAALKERV